MDWLIVTDLQGYKMLVSLHKINYIDSDRGITDGGAIVHLEGGTILKLRETITEITETIDNLYN